MKKNIKELSHLDLDDLATQVETHAVDVENKVIAALSHAMSSQEGVNVPVFDFEINWFAIIFSLYKALKKLSSLYYSMLK